MKVRWIHTADVHLGYQQYGLPQRANDFARAFRYVCEYAISARVDFMLIAGDLFHKRAVDARTMYQAYGLLAGLKDAGIPVLCVEGNHERAFYNAGWTWLDYLSSTGLLRLLAPTHTEAGPRLDPWDDEDSLGGYIDLGPVRVIGIKYYGSSAHVVHERLAEQLTAMPDRPFSVMMLHEGMEGQIPRSIGGLSSSQLEVLRPHCEYLAMGHIHKRYEFGGPSGEHWAHNPGSLETVSSEEVEWERGFYEVTADTATRELLEVRHHTVPRRPFFRFFLGVEACGSPQALEEMVLRDVGRKLSRGDGPAPVLDVTLKGTLQFSDGSLHVDELEARLRDAFAPLIVRVKNNTMPAGYGVNVAMGEDGQIDRRALELGVLTELVARDARYASAAADWARTFQDLKDVALGGRPPEEAVALLEQGLERAVSARSVEAGRS